MSGSHIISDDPSSDGGRDVGDASELSPRHLMDAVTREDL